MTQPKDEQDWLDAALADLKETAPPSEAFLARLTAEALAVQPAAPGALPARAEPPKVSVLRQVLDVLGGWGGVGGLAMATCAGLAVGLANPVGLEDTMNTVLNWSIGGATAGDTFGGSAFGWDLEEG